MAKVLYLLIFLFFTSVLNSCSLFGVRSLENPTYKVTLSDFENNIEIRSYEKTKLVSTSNAGEFRESSNSNFKKLFKYISGENKSEKKISMTAPVFVNLSSSKDKSSQKQMSFVVPSSLAGNTPEPSSNEVLLNYFPKRTVAVISFSGSWDEESFSEKEKVLRTWLSENSYSASAEAYSAAYDPPWAIPSLRKNEVHIVIEDL